MKIAFASGSGSACPYWSRCWPSALALAEFLQGHPAYIQNRRVLELAAGLGLPSLVSAGYASHVTASDLVPEAVELIRLSAERSGINNLDACVINWNNPLDLKGYEVLLLSDVNYAPQDFERLYGIIKTCVEMNILVLLATPQRLQAGAFMTRLQEWQQFATQMEAEDEWISVWGIGQK